MGKERFVPDSTCDANKVMTMLGSKVAEKYARSRGRLDSSLRQRINRELVQAGFGGRGRWQKPGLALSDAMEVLSKHGLEQDEIPNSHALSQPTGTYSVNVAFSNEEDPFSPMAISNTALHLSWTELAPYKLEVISYLS